MLRHLKWTLLPFALVAQEPVAAFWNYNQPQDQNPQDQDWPWFTGPLEAPSGAVTPAHHWDFEPYLNFFVHRGPYDNDWKATDQEKLFVLNPQFSYWIGLTEWLDIFFAPQFFVMWQGSAHSIEFGDFPMGFDFGLWKDYPDSWIPEVKISLIETFPTGRYKHLGGTKQFTDASGSGAYTTEIDLVFGKLIKINDTRYLNTRWSFAWSIPSDVRVSGLNAYGGARHTHGKVKTGQSLVVDFGYELTLDRHWCLALDLIASYTGRNRFKGHHGKTKEISRTHFRVVKAEVGSPASIEYSMAPALEYNWNQHYGLIFGSWFPVAGKNAIRFASGIFAFNIYW